MTIRAYNFKPGEREKAVERMRLRNANPVFAEKAARRASIRMRQIHEAAKAMMGKSQ